MLQNSLQTTFRQHVKRIKFLSEATDVPGIGAFCHPLLSRPFFRSLVHLDNRLGSLLTPSTEYNAEGQPFECLLTVCLAPRRLVIQPGLIVQYLLTHLC